MPHNCASVAIVRDVGDPPVDKRQAVIIRASLAPFVPVCRAARQSVTNKKGSASTTTKQEMEALTALPFGAQRHQYATIVKKHWLAFVCRFAPEGAVGEAQHGAHVDAPSRMPMDAIVAVDHGRPGCVTKRIVASRPAQAQNLAKA